MNEETWSESAETRQNQSNSKSRENSAEIDDAGGGTPMDTAQSDSEDVADDVEQSEKAPTAEEFEKSRIQKLAFLEMFQIAPRVRDVLPDLRNFVNHPDVIEADRDEINELVQHRICEEKALKKAEKARELRNEPAARAPVDLAQAIRSVTGIDLLGIARTTPPLQNPPILPISQPSEPIFTPPVLEPTSSAVPILGALREPEVAPAPLVLGGPAPAVVRRGKAGFVTPHPSEIPTELRNAVVVPPIPEDVAPIPDELRVITNHNKKKPEVPPIPNELLPLDRRVPEPIPVVPTRPTIRRTLILAGARPGKRQERLEAVLEKEREEQRLKRRAESDRKNPIGVLNRSLPPGVAKIPMFSLSQEKKKARGFGRRQPPAASNLPTGLNKNSPNAVKQYHARHLAKETGMSMTEAMAEIEEMIENGGAQETDDLQDQWGGARGRDHHRNGYTPVDHSAGIPGVDRPPGAPARAYPPGPPQERRKRGGRREKERRRRQEEAAAAQRRFAASGGDAPPPRNKYARYENEPRGGGAGYEHYSSYNSQYQQDQNEYGRYEGYEGYYDGQERGYENYDQGRYHHHHHQQYEGHYDENGGGGGGRHYDYYAEGGGAGGGGDEGQANSYHQEDGSQYYNEYYGVTEPTPSSTTSSGAPGGAAATTSTTATPWRQ